MLNAAVRISIDLLSYLNTGGVATAKELSDKGFTTYDFAQQLCGKLRRAELVRALRGPGGGFVITEKGRKATIADVIAAVEKPISAATPIRKSDYIMVELVDFLNARRAV